MTGFFFGFHKIFTILPRLHIWDTTANHPGL